MGRAKSMPGSRVLHHRRGTAEAIGCGTPRVALLGRDRGDLPAGAGTESLDRRLQSIGLGEIARCQAGGHSAIARAPRRARTSAARAGSKSLRSCRHCRRRPRGPRRDGAPPDNRSSNAATNFVSELHRFIFDGLPVRGILVRLAASWREMLSRRAAPPTPSPEPVQRLLGEMAAAGVLMHANIKFDGALLLQVYGDGPVKLAVAEIAHRPRLPRHRHGAAAQCQPKAHGWQRCSTLHGQGRCAITLDPVDRLLGQQPYQGVVPLHGDQREPLQRLSQVLEHYMLQSEQLDTRLVLAADDQCAAGLSSSSGCQPRARGCRSGDEDQHRPQRGLQPHRPPGGHAHARGAAESRRRHGAAPPVLGGEAALLRAARRRRAPRFACTLLARARSARMLRGLGPDESRRHHSPSSGRSRSACEFCGQRCTASIAVDVGELFVAPAEQAPGSNSIN